jgi:putative membrane protein
MVRFTRYAAALSACLMMAAAAQAQRDPAGEAQPAGQARQGAGSKVMDLDKHFLKEACVDNMFEVKVSEIAAKNAQDEKVKQFAQMMIQDHQQANEQIKQIAQKEQVQLPTDLPELKKEEIAIFQGLKGSEFDQAYLSCMKVAHAKDVAAFAEKAKNAKDPEVKTFAAATLPKLMQHRQHVMAMTGDTGAPGEAQPAGARQGAEQGSSGSGSTGGTSSSGTGGRQTGSGTSTGGGTTGAGSKSE